MLNKSKGKQKTIKKDNLIVVFGIKISSKQNTNASQTKFKINVE